MTDTTNDKKLDAFIGDSPAKRDAIAAGLGILRRSFRAFVAAMHESRRRQAQRDIARFTPMPGGPMTDDFEREMNRRLFASDWNRRG